MTYSSFLVSSVYHLQFRHTGDLAIIVDLGSQSVDLFVNEFFDATSKIVHKVLLFHDWGHKSDGVAMSPLRQRRIIAKLLGAAS